MDDLALLRHRIADHLVAVHAVLEDDALLARTTDVAEAIVEAFRAGGKVIAFGNGGSAADATHLAAELVGRFALEREALPALSLTDNCSTTSAVANDYGFDEVFARQVRAFGSPGDVALALSTSGRSPNVVAAVEAARDAGLRTVAITGASGGDLAAAADVCLHLPSEETARIQECTMVLGHVLCEIVERALFPAPVSG